MARVEVVERHELPFGHLVSVLTVSACGARQWGLRADGLSKDGSRPQSTLIASGFIDADLPVQLRALADALEALGGGHEA
ncbi:hypothetical protein [Pseudooceanicola algae]|uniref:hypothetical protein n=1 Tax=Pseudooceanicola algae TaxID=1537215 RepID=UPI0011C36595|nr:hypothetical protein [Pseudooceanicola algae]